MAGVARARGRAPVDQRPCPGGRASHRRAAWHPVQRSPLGGAPGDRPHGRPARHPQPRRPHHLRADSGRRRPAGRHRPHRARHTPDPHQHLRGVSLRPAGDHRGGARHGHEQGPALLLHQGALGVPLAFSGVRTAATEVIASASLAAYIGAGGLGVLIYTGLGALRTDLLWIGGLSVAALSLIVNRALAAVDRRVRRYERAADAARR